MDMNDRRFARYRVLARAVVANGYPREAGFDITVALEIMAILCLSTSIEDLERRIGQIVVAAKRDKGQILAQGYQGAGRHDGAAERCADAEPGADTGKQPAFVHGGPLPISPMAAIR
jgi:formate--tetrahydrofolate ligase